MSFTEPMTTWRDLKDGAGGLGGGGGGGGGLVGGFEGGLVGLVGPIVWVGLRSPMLAETSPTNERVSA